MATNDAGKSAALGGSDDIDELFVRENIDQDAIASLDRGRLFAFYGLGGFDGYLFDHLDGRHVRLGEVAGHGLVDLRGLDEVNVSDLGGIIAVLREGLELGDDAGTRFEHGDRVNVAAVIEQLGHADLFSENSDY